jgi:hypothetical protein
MFHRANKLTRLSLSEWRDLLRAEWALIRALWLVRTRPTGSLVGPGGEDAEDAAPSSESEAAAHDDIDPRALALALAVERAAEYGPIRPKCLVRAVALDQLLHGSGFEGSVVRVGVRQGAGHFSAHAWVEYQGAVLGDRDWRVRKFSELSNVEVSS